MIQPGYQIGNIVTINNKKSWPHMKGRPVYVTGFDERIGPDKEFTYSLSLKDKLEDSSSYSQFIKFIEPIKLTEEWLIKFGFERKTRITDNNQRIPVWAKYSFMLTIWDDGRLFYDWLGGNIDIQHVHHLQNIYSDLLRKELTITKLK